VLPSAPSVRRAPQAVEPVAPGKLSVATKRVTVKILAKKDKRVKLTKLLANGLVGDFRSGAGAIHGWVRDCISLTRDAVLRPERPNYGARDLPSKHLLGRTTRQLTRRTAASPARRGPSFTTNPAVRRSRRSFPLSGAIQKKSSATGALMLTTRHSTPPRRVARLLLRCRCVSTAPRAQQVCNRAPCPGQSRRCGRLPRL
jgi:hypothetical protein